LRHLLNIKESIMHIKALYIIIAIALLSSPLASASGFGSKAVQQPLYPVSPLLVQKGTHSTYPSVAGDFMVFNTGKADKYRVVRVSKHSPESTSRPVKTIIVSETIRFGVALNNGSVGYVSNRSGPASGWMWQGNGESHVAIGHMGSLSGNIGQYHLNASSDGQVWCYDTSLQKLNRNIMLNALFVQKLHDELEGQLWRTYDSDNFRRKQSYKATASGKKNDFNAPVLYVLNRTNMQLNMIPHAFDGTLSSDGRKVVFVRETRGNYDLWMQTIDGQELVQLTDSSYGDFEPQFSPDNSKLLFVSNRDSSGKVTRTSIYMMDLKTSQITRLTNSARAADGGPAWLDDNTIVFHSNRSLKQPQAKTGSNWNIWQLKLN